jgi:hypothetical protein
MSLQDDLAKERLVELQKTGFEQWLARSETSALLSVIPDTKDNDIFMLVLRSAYCAGFEIGQGHFAIAMLKDMFPNGPFSPSRR